MAENIPELNVATLLRMSPDLQRRIIAEISPADISRLTEELVKLMCQDPLEAMAVSGVFQRAALDSDSTVKAGLLSDISELVERKSQQDTFTTYLQSQAPKPKEL